ncbi:MAG: ATP-binding protein [Ponticaulis sp.]|nr:ATP-binding protein [Ponticaulis sp.]|tara:strand:+ start:8476 stop:9858 length:1383 start_codon:yes stop_codon:yes gene_type:complete
MNFGKTSLARRLVLGSAVFSFVMLGLTAWILSTLNRQQALDLFQSELDATLGTLTSAANVTDYGEVFIIETRAPTDERFSTPLAGRYWLIAGLNTEGDRISEVSSNSVWDWVVPWDDFAIQAAINAPGEPQFSDSVGPNGEPLRIATKSVILPGEWDSPVILIAGADRSEINRITRQFLITLVISLGLLALGLIAAMFILVRLGLAPLVRVQRDVADIRIGEKQHLDDNYPQEILPLTLELNKLLDHNKAVVDRARTHVGNLAHALKTPIAVLMNEAQSDDPMSSLVRRQTQAMSDNVQHYLKRAQAAARAEVLGARTPIEPAIEDLTRLLQRLFAEKGLSVAPGQVEPLVFRGERQDLDEMLGNLLENACKFASSKVRVVAERGTPEELVIHVDDDGPGLSPEERKEAMKRGVRLDETAPGTGLGLSIVKDLSELYSGRFELSDSPLGGLRATLILPSV